MLSEKYLNNRIDISSNRNYMISVLEDLRSRVGKLLIHHPSERYFKSLFPIISLIQENIYFTNILRGYFRNEFPFGNHVLSGINKENEMKKLEDLIRNLDVSNKNQTMAFNGTKIYEIYEKSIVQVSNFTLHRTSKLSDDLSSTSTLYYDIVLPFHNKNYDANSTDCKPWFELPWFFSGLN